MKMFSKLFNTASNRDAKCFAPSDNCARNNGNSADFSDVAAAASVLLYIAVSVIIAVIITLGLYVVNVIMSAIIIYVIITIITKKHRAKPIYVHSED